MDREEITARLARLGDFDVDELCCSLLLGEGQCLGLRLDVPSSWPCLAQSNQH